MGLKIRGKSLTSLPDRISAADYQAMIESSTLVDDDGKARAHPEQDQQIKLFQIVEQNLAKYPLASHLIHIPNGDLRDKLVAAKLKQAGVKRGVSDLFLPVPTGKMCLNNDGEQFSVYRFAGLWIELKVKPNKPSTDQINWLQSMNGLGYVARVAYSANEAWRVITTYLDDTD